MDYEKGEYVPIKNGDGEMICEGTVFPIFGGDGSVAMVKAPINILPGETVSVKVVEVYESNEAFEASRRGKRYAG